MKYCKECSPLYDENFRNRFAFLFNVNRYPDLFDKNQIDLIGWFSGGPDGEWDQNKLTRDHKVSVNEAIKNGYDPFYITHPLNCELMSWIENNRKKAKSSITYEELKRQVDQYENNRKGLK